MKLSKILRFLWAVVWRLMLTALTLVLVVSVAICMTLGTIFTGPSLTARDALVATMMEYESASKIPILFLGEDTVAQICQYESALADTTSDPARITPVDTGISHQETISLGERTAIVTVSYRPITFASHVGECYAGLNENGILILSTSADVGLTQRCEKILILNGQYNTGLYAATSGYGPRLAIGQAADGASIRVSMDCGTYQELIDIMTAYGAINACALSAWED